MTNIDPKPDLADPESKAANSCLFIISAPSGTGKTTLCRALCLQFPDIIYSVSHTTRSPREGEFHGKDYFFITENEFKDGIEAEKWAEWAIVHDNFYGTSSEFLDRHLDAGGSILLDIDVAGTKQILTKYPKAITIFIMPPSMKALENRLIKRGTDDARTIEKRIRNAEKEIAEKDFYRHVVINDDLDRATSELIAVVGLYRTGQK